MAGMKLKEIRAVRQTHEGKISGGTASKRPTGKPARIAGFQSAKPFNPRKRPNP